MLVCSKVLTVKWLNVVFAWLVCAKKRSWFFFLLPMELLLHTEDSNIFFYSFWRLWVGFWLLQSWDFLLQELSVQLPSYLASLIPKCSSRWPRGDLQHLMAHVVHDKMRMYWSSWLTTMLSVYYLRRTLLRPRHQKEFQPFNNPHFRLEHFRLWKGISGWGI